MDDRQLAAGIRRKEEKALDQLIDQTEKMILEQEMEHEIRTLLSSLSKRDQELFRRRYINEESVDEISRDMKLAPSILYNRLSRGKKKLRHALRRSHNET